MYRFISVALHYYFVDVALEYAEYAADLTGDSKSECEDLSIGTTGLYEVSVTDL